MITVRIKTQHVLQQELYLYPLLPSYCDQLPHRSLSLLHNLNPCIHFFYFPLCLTEIIHLPLASFSSCHRLLTPTSHPLILTFFSFHLSLKVTMYHFILNLKKKN